MFCPSVYNLQCFFLQKSTYTLNEVNLQSTMKICINLQTTISRQIRLETDDLLFHCKKSLLPIQIIFRNFEQFKHNPDDNWMCWCFDAYHIWVIYVLSCLLCLCGKNIWFRKTCNYRIKSTIIIPHKKMAKNQSQFYNFIMLLVYNLQT